MRGASKKEAMNRVKEFIRLYKPFIIVLLETRISASAALKFAGRLGSQWKAETVASWGLSGGILFMWNSNEVDCHPRVRSRQIVHAAISIGNSEPWLISAIYAGQLMDDRKYLLQELSKISELDAPWLVVGDFNMITGAEEARGGKQFHISKSVRIFRDFIASHDLVDLGFSGHHLLGVIIDAGLNVFGEGLIVLLELPRGYSGTPSAGF